MRKLKFKSLTMRIWATFTMIILLIICSISFIYLFAYKNITESNMIKDLKVAHNILLKGQDFTNLNRFDELENLKGSDHFIVDLKDGSETNIIDFKDVKRSNPIQNNEIHKPFGNNDLKDWMISFINGEMYENEFEEVYNDKKFTFIISCIEEKDGEMTYLISYIPNLEENNLFYTVVFISIVFIVIGFITAKVVANYISKPLKILEEHTIRIAHKDWKDAIIIKSEDEIGRLAEAMNFMQTELKRIDEEEKLFLQSISHDLKTPVMVIMSHAEAIIDGI